MKKTIFISGADKGLGFSLTLKFLKKGFHVFAGAHSSSSNLSSLLKEFPEMLTVVTLDVTNMESVRKAIQEVTKHVPFLDILINNAGVHPGDKNAVLENIDLTDMHLKKTMDVNAYGPLRMVQQFLPLLEKGNRKLIINISSEAGSIEECWRTKDFVYCMSKAAINIQSKILQNYLGPRGFKILSVHPGWMRTDMGGPKADISPDESAEGIFKLAIKKWKADDVIYLDYKGKAMRW